MVIKSGLERTTTATIDRGLYVLRYASAGSDVDAPMVFIRPSYGSEDAVRLIPAPGASATSLTRPGSALVLVSETRTSIQITVQAVGKGEPVAELKLEPIETVAAPSNSVQRQTLSNTSSSSEGFELVGHVAWRGDVSVPAGRWVAGPDAPAPIEGLGVNWPAGQNQGLDYQVYIQGDPAWSEWTAAGRFAGTRGLAKSLVGVRFRLDGADRGQILKGSALFLGSGVIEKSGSMIEFRSAAGYDPLVGLSLEVTSEPRAMHNIAPTDVAPRPQGERRGRVRVFRAGIEQK